MRYTDRQQQLRIRIRYAIFLVSGLIIGLILGILIGRNSKQRTRSEPYLYTQIEHTLELPASETTSLIYENYWNFISMSYIMVGTDREDCLLYKISANVPRHDYDLERFYLDDDGYMRYSSDTVPKTRIGLDISNFQGEIDWETLGKEREIDFIMMRVGYRGYSEGGLMLDDAFGANAQAAEEQRIDIGVYFFSQAVSYEEGVEEAEFVISNIKERKITYPVVIDTEKMEVDGARANDITNEERTDAIVGFCETIKEAGYTPMIYANRNWYAQNLDMDRLGEYQLWLAQYANVPDFPYRFTGWQYTSEGTVPGISGVVDLNLWFPQ